MRFSRFRVALLSAVIPAAVVLAGCNQPPAPAPAPAAPPAPSPVERGQMLVVGGGCHDCHTPKRLTERGPEADLSRALQGHPQEEVIASPFKGASPGWTTHTNDNLTAWSGAWGVSFAANLTPDDTGIGTWSEEMFVNALKSGKHQGAGRPILPPMPWNWYGQLPEEDLKAMYAYLKSIKPIANKVPPPLGPDGKPVS
jgi:mono/diheme cytochrome c family protein